jgi:hypothetical protein
MSFEVTRQQLLKQASFLDSKFKTTGNQEFRDEAIRLRRIVEDLAAIFVSGVSELNDLSDVDITTPSNGETLIYNSTTSQWENQPIPDQGIGLYSQTAQSTPIVNTITPGSLIDGGVGYLTVPANGFQVGDSFVAYFSGQISSSNNQQMRIQISSDSGILADTGTITLSSTTNKSWEMQINFTIRQIGPSGTASIATSGRFMYNKNSNNAPENIGFNSVNTTSFNTTINNTLSIMFNWFTASHSNTIHTDIFNLYKVY